MYVVQASPIPIDPIGGWAGKLMPDVRTKEGDEKAKVAAQELIRKLLSSE